MTRAEKLRALAGALDVLSVARRQSVANDGTVIIGLVLGSALSTECYNHHAYVSNIALCAALEAEVARREAALKEDGDACDPRS